MYLFSRSTVASIGKQLEALPAAVSMAERVSGILGQDVNVFTGRFGAPLGTVTWSMRVDSFDQVQSNNDKLMGRIHRSGGRHEWPVHGTRRRCDGAVYHGASRGGNVKVLRSHEGGDG